MVCYEWTRTVKKTAGVFGQGGILGSVGESWDTAGEICGSGVVAFYFSIFDRVAASCTNKISLRASAYETQLGSGRGSDIVLCDCGGAIILARKPDRGTDTGDFFGYHQFPFRDNFSYGAELLRMDEYDYRCGF